MDIAARVRQKSDRPGRVLVATFWISPMVLPIVAVGVSALMGVPSPNPPPPRAPALEEKRLAIAPMTVVPKAAPGPVAGRPQADDEVTTASIPNVKMSGVHVLRNVVAVEGLRLGAEGMVILLAGIGPMPPGSECRRLDRVLEPCARRAMNRLEILTRERPVTCDLSMQRSGAELTGTCRAGKIDLAEDLVRNGLALRKGL